MKYVVFIDVLSVVHFTIQTDLEGCEIIRVHGQVPPVMSLLQCFNPHVIVLFLSIIHRAFRKSVPS